MTDLVASATALTQSVDSLGEKVVIAERQVRKVRRLGIITTAGLIFDITLTLIVGGLLHRVDHNARTIKSVECSFYGLVLSAYHPELQPAAHRAAYTAQFKIIRDNDARLGCPPLGKVK